MFITQGGCSINYLWIAVPPGYGRSWSSSAAEDEELLQMMDNLEECLTSSTLCKLTASYVVCTMWRVIFYFPVSES